jgi:hypothetical protein
MEFLLFPLRLKGAPHFVGARGAVLQKIERSDVETNVPERESVAQLIRIMFDTPNGSWKACPHFGFRNFLIDDTGRRDALDRSRDEINKALEDLGITHYRVKELVKDVTSSPFEILLDAVIVSSKPGEQGFSIGLSGRQ